MSSDEITKSYEKMAGKYRVPLTVIETLAKLIQYGRGEGLRTTIPELGGEVIWKPKLGASVGNGFNRELNNRATELCNEISKLLKDEDKRDETTIVADLDATTGFMPVSIAPSSKTWWPERYGTEPTLTGNAGGLRYAYFKSEDRLVVQNNLRNRIFDTSGFIITDVTAGRRPGFFNTVIKTPDGDLSITRFREVAK